MKTKVVEPCDGSAACTAPQHIEGCYSGLVRRLTMWQCECGWSNTGADEKCQCCFLYRP